MYISNNEYKNFDINYSQIIEYYNSIMPEIYYNSKFNLLKFKKHNISRLIHLKRDKKEINNKSYNQNKY